jgi:hypothetical protein
MSVFSDVPADQGPGRAAFAALRRLLPAGSLPAGRCAMVQLFSIALALFVLAHLQDRTLTILVALLGLAYASIRAATIASVFEVRRMAAAWDNELSLLRKAVLSAPAAETIAVAATRSRFNPLDCQRRLEYAGLAIVGTICLFYLLSALVYGIAYQQLFM